MLLLWVGLKHVWYVDRIPNVVQYMLIPSAACTYKFFSLGAYFVFRVVVIIVTWWEKGLIIVTCCGNGFETVCTRPNIWRVTKLKTVIISTSLAQGCVIITLQSCCIIVT